MRYSNVRCKHVKRISSHYLMWIWCVCALDYEFLTLFLPWNVILKEFQALNLFCLPLTFFNYFICIIIIIRFHSSHYFFLLILLLLNIYTTTEAVLLSLYMLTYLLILLPLLQHVSINLFIVNEPISYYYMLYSSFSLQKILFIYANNFQLKSN